ncbi:hypothetical protein [uncultured Acetatifactor sp.]|uniref:hypothetical protein n=1 Tax=uncultured Acetatifactor sp. TaxID=1671927 RepID=UPI002628606B|nr:hypothetical protein [uncultured Acetatifactor sp.]
MKAQIQCHCPHIARNCLPLFFTLRSTLLSYLAHTVLFYRQYYLTKDTSIILSARSSPQKQTHNAESALWKFHALSIPYHKEVSTNNCCKFMAIFIVFPGFCLKQLQQLFSDNS